jgi:hypothetical protein
MRNIDPERNRRTIIYRRTESDDQLVGFLGPDASIYRLGFPSAPLPASPNAAPDLRWDEATPEGRFDHEGRLFRLTQHDERELGTFTQDGKVHSHGLFEGGPVGWVDADGSVFMGGLILGEEEVGRVDGPNHPAGAAALLLLFLPDEQEAGKRSGRA